MSQLYHPAIYFSPSLNEYYEGFRYYYAFGNTPAEDFLEHVLDNPCPSVLSLGCGDMRSCFYTLWKNFDPIFDNGWHFTGVKFVLNDISPAILARNVLFLYLVVKLYEQPNQREWVCAMWAIWFSHELLPNHNCILKEALVFLLSISDSVQNWKESSANPLRYTVRFTSDSTLQSMHQFWNMWLTQFNGRGKIEWMHKMRNNVVKVGQPNFGIMVSHMPKEEHSKMLNDYVGTVGYSKSGCTFAEVAFEMAVSAHERFINPTFFEKVDDYTLHYASHPYDCFHHSVSFLLSDLKESGISLESMKFPKVQQKCFAKTPVLANCVQQFIFWIISSASILSTTVIAKAEHVTCTFDLNCSDALIFAMQLQHDHNLFDAIYTSNLADHLSLPPIVLSVSPLLSEEGFLSTTISLHRYFAHYVNDYLAKCFGFPPNVLPTLLGIRCIRQEGPYADTVAVRHAAPSEYITNLVSKQIHNENKEPGRHVRHLVWEQLKSPTCNIEQLDSTSLQFVSLYQCIVACALSVYLPLVSGKEKLNRCTTQTAMLAVIAFSRIVKQSNGIVDYTFWDGLCQLLRNDKRLAPYLLHLQTQALYGNVHLHLTLTTDDCPLCTGVPLEQAFTKLVVEFKPGPVKHESDAHSFIAFVHNSKYDLSATALVDKVNADTHIIDSSVYSVRGEEVVMETLLPSSTVRSMNFGDYSLTIMQFAHFKGLSDTAIFLRPFVSLVQQGCVQPLQHIHLPSCINRKDMVETSFGKIVQCYQVYTGKGGVSYVNTVAISDAVMALIEGGHVLNTASVSESVLRISCSSHSIDVEYYMPINYNGIKLQLSRKKRSVTVTTPLGKYMFYNDRAMSIKNPNNRVVLPCKTISPITLMTFIGLQYLTEEGEIIKIQKAKNLPIPPMIEIKRIIAFIISSHSNVCQLCDGTGENNGFILVHSRIFDFELQTPAIDVSFYINESHIPCNVFVAWSKMRIYFMGKDESEIVCNAETAQLTRKVFQYFARRTKVSHSSSKNQYHHYGVDKTFTRAIIYPLYYEADVLDADMEKQEVSPSIEEVSIEEKCSGCGKLSSVSLKKCASCKSVSYCSKECQVKDWSTHKVTCNKVPPSIDEPSIEEPSIEEKCSGCGKLSPVSLKKCTSCKSVSYCSKECQAKDWSTHKVTCHQIPSCIDEPSIEEPSIEEKCSGCGKSSSISLKKCASCKSVSYCSKECQVKDWSAHKVTCHQVPPSIEELEECSGCGKSSSILLMKCTRCKSVSYCSKECQRKDWPRHKDNCKN